MAAWEVGIDVMSYDKLRSVEVAKNESSPWGEAIARPEQYLSEHSSNVSDLAAQFGGAFGMADTMRVAGHWHDLGKLSHQFQEYIGKIALGTKVERGSVKHSVFGASWVCRNVSSAPVPAEILGNIIAAHHGALYDSLSPDGSTPLADKLRAAAGFTCAGRFPSIETEPLKREMDILIGGIPKNERAFAVSMLTKLAFSCLVDADRLDAYLHEIGGECILETPDWGAMLSSLERTLANRAKSGAHSEMTALRQAISASCAKAGKRASGVYKLEAPTGGGKTLSSLRFALEHAQAHNLERVIYVIPYLSILSQTAKEIRSAVDADDKMVLEHHSNYFPDDESNHRFRTNRWDAPVVLTTLVQFLESIFSARGGDLRKLHNMARSVLIFDEAQSLPIKCVHLFNGAVNFLRHVCGSTVLLCTATQPLLDYVERPIRFSDNPSIAECGEIPKRYRITNAMRTEGYSYPELAEFVLEKHEGSTLVIVNTKAAAKALHEELKQREAAVLHLSTNMCSAHRDAVIEELRRRLDSAVNESVICVSTQLIEAGVDISFSCVIRDLAGLDSVYQAAGRCNRHGEYGVAKSVYVINIAGENLNRLPDIKKGAEIARRLFDDGNADINLYYKLYFYDRRDQMDYPLPGGGSIYDLLSRNAQGYAAFKDRADKKEGRPAMPSAIRSAAEGFFVIDKGRTKIVVRYGGADELLQGFVAETDLVKKRDLLRGLEKHSVDMYEFQLDALTQRGALDDLNYGGLTVLDRGFYDSERGVDLDGSHEFLYL